MMAGAGIITIIVCVLLVPILLVKGLVVLAWRAARLTRTRRAVPLQQRSVTRATAGAFVLAVCAILAAHGFPVVGWKLTAGLAALSVLYLLAGIHGARGARFDFIAVFWCAALVIVAAVFLTLEGFPL